MKFYKTPDDYYDDYGKPITHEEKMEERGRQIASFNSGTPKSLQEAIEHLVAQPLERIVSGYGRQTLRDFISQKFCVAMLDAGSDDEADNLARLFHAIVGEDESK